MSRRHRTESVPAVSRAERRAHQRSERQQTRSQLSTMADLAADAEQRDELIEPLPYFRPEHDHSAPERSTRSRYAHWKQPFWKRRSRMRAQRARLFRST